MAKPPSDSPAPSTQRKTLSPLTWLLILALSAATMLTTQAELRNFATVKNIRVSLNDEDLADRAGFDASLLPILLARAQAGDKSAMYFYGDLFDPNDFTGETTEPKNAATANDWYRRAVALDDQGAERNLGINYYFGTGMPENDKMAVALFERAAAKNDDSGDYFLGLMLQNGQGEPENLPRAVALEQAAVAQGHALAEDQLGLMYYGGIGVAQNLEKARAEWKLAAAQGNPDAVRFLNQTEPSAKNAQTNTDQSACGNFYSVMPSPALVIKVHDCFAAGYDPSQPTGNFVFSAMIRMLEDAGVKRLLTSPGGMTTPERVAILNDYGVWYYKLLVNDPRIKTYYPACKCLVDGYGAAPSDSAQALAILKRVVQLAPTRTAAWLNLGDLYASMLNPKFVGTDANATWAGKQRLTQAALSAYKQHLALTPAPTKYEKDFMALNDTNDTSSNVCQFVRAFTRENRLDETFSYPSNMYGTPVDLFGEGTSYYVYMGVPELGPGPGSRDATPIGRSLWFIAAYTKPQIRNDDGLPPGTGSVDFKPLGLSYGLPYYDDVRIIVFHNLYYVLAINYSDANDATPAPPPPYATLRAASVDVVQPNHGLICHIGPHLRPRLAVGAGNPLCAKFIHGDRFSQPAKIMPSAADLHTDGSPFFPFQIPSAIFKVDLENNGQLQSIASVPPGLMLYNPIAHYGIDSHLNDAIQALPHAGSDEHLITYGGAIYIETGHGKVTLPGEVERAGLYEIRNDKILPVCLIGNDFSYTAR